VGLSLGEAQILDCVGLVFGILSELVIGAL
jgi:hypothetical protein